MPALLHLSKTSFQRNKWTDFMFLCYPKFETLKVMILTCHWPYSVIVITKRESFLPAFLIFCCWFVCFSITLGVFALQSEITWSGASFWIAGLLTPWQNKMYYNNNVFNYLWVYCFERSSCLFCRCKKYSSAPNLWEYSLFNSNVLFSTEPFCDANRRQAQILYLTLLVFW